MSNTKNSIKKLFDRYPYILGVLIGIILYIIIEYIKKWG
ncbi:hypothetical protein BTW14_gp031 [BeAn 58058 virus]|nr:hypothetical protein BTW14_gp031 [BeAn 58058 virus]APG58222.1 hypothetical protein BAV00034 [BeAn 58058 virus]